MKTLKYESTSVSRPYIAEWICACLVTNIGYRHQRFQVCSCLSGFEKNSGESTHTHIYISQLSINIASFASCCGYSLHCLLASETAGLWIFCGFPTKKQTKKLGRIHVYINTAQCISHLIFLNHNFSKKSVNICCCFTGSRHICPAHFSSCFSESQLWSEKR